MTKTIEHAGITLPPEIVDELTRREFLIGAGLLALAPGCGSDGGEGNTSSNTRVIDHKFGSTEISGRPERVVSIGYKEQDSILALGVRPVAARYWFGDEDDVIFPWAEDEAGGAEPEILDMRGSLNFEKIAALEPDVILGVNSGMSAEDYETLSQIAPTVAQTDEFVDLGVPWQAELRMVGETLGRSERAEERITELDALLAAAREERPEFAGQTLAFASYAEDQVGVFNSQDIRSRLFSDLGFKLPKEYDELAGEKFYAYISRERLELLDHDVLVWSGIQFVEGGRDTIENDPLIQALDVARNGRMVFVEGELDAALNFASVLSIPFVIDKLVPMLASAIDGDPSTTAEETTG